MNRPGLALTLCVALFSAACGSNGGSMQVPPPSNGNFSAASLSGQYAFAMSGADGLTGSFFARVGSFTADGKGNITAGIEDVNTVINGPQTITFTTPSTYSVQPDGTGTINLTGTGPLSFSITMLSPTHGLIVETDNQATASGTFALQNTNSFNTAAISGPYVFDFSGLDPVGAPDTLVGQLVANGSGTFSGLLDENDDTQLSGASALSSATYQMDPVNGATFGKGTASFNANGKSFSYLFYIVNGSRLHFMQTGSAALTVGDAVTQANVPASNTNFNGSFAYLLTGSGPNGPLTRIGRFAADGNGGLSNIVADTNDAGTVAKLPDGSLSAMTYSIDTVNAGTGRGTLKFTDSHLGTFQYIFYLTSASGGVIQDISTNTVGDGSLALQTGAPFSNAGLTGDFAFNFSGVSSNGTTGLTAEEDFVGHLHLSSSSSSNASGTADFSEFSSNQGIFTNVNISGNGLTLSGDGSNSSGSSRNTLALKLAGSPSTTLDFAPYIVNSQTIFVAGTDTDRVISGVITEQAP